ncbi:MAG: ribosome maturation factor RimP [Bryobacteraceae bacterium]|nr:MAG: ribosome maturation factor RimP [Bryobacteraceae bacterium]
MPSATRDSLIQRVAEIAGRTARREGLSVWDVELAGSGRRRVLRIYIDKPGGVTLDDCERISQQVGAVLDAEDVVPGDSYQLEVSSPGVERRLSRPHHFELCRGQKVRLQLREPVEGQRRWEGVLQGLEEGRVVLETGSGKIIRFGMEIIEKANLQFEW